MKTSKNDSHQIKDFKRNHKMKIPLLVLILILGLALKLTLNPKPLLAQPPQCDHDHHAAKPAVHNSGKQEHEGHEEHDDEQHHDTNKLKHNPEEHNNHDDHNDHREGDRHNHADHSLESETTADHPNRSCELGHNHADDEPDSAAACSDEAIHMSPAEMKQFGIVVEKAAAGHLETSTRVRGQIALNRDRMAQIVPKVSGTVTEIYKTLGDSVEKGEIMALIESQELADAKTGFLNAGKHLELARIVFKREQKLRRKKINSESEYLNAQKNLATAKITYTSSEQRLIFLGLSPAEIKQLPSESGMQLSRFAVRSPFSGDVIKKEVILGQNLRDATPIFTVADLSTVWVDLNLYAKDTVTVERGDRVIITPQHPEGSVNSTIAYVAPLVDPQTRTTKARVTVDNHTGRLRPGSMVTAEIITGESKAGVVVEKSIIQDVAERKCIFVQSEHGFEARPVILGTASARRVEIRSGIQPGELIVTRNSFRLKAALETGVGAGCSSPGHAH